MPSKKTKVTVRVISRDAKVIGSLVGGCRISIRDALTGETLAQGLHRGGSGDSESIMKRPHARGAIIYGTEDAAAFTADLELAEPRWVEITAQGPLAYPHALQRASKTTWLIPGENVTGEGILLELHGYIVDIMVPESVDVFHSHDPVHLQTSVRLL